MKTQLSSGCSIETPFPIWSPITSQHIASRFGLKYDNVAHGGAGNFFILQSIVNRILYDNTIDFVTVGWTWYGRIDLFDQKGNLLPQTLKYENMLDEISTEENRIDTINQIHSSQIYQTFMFVYLLQNLLTQRKIQYCMWWTIAPVFVQPFQKVIEIYNRIDKQRFYKFEESVFDHSPDVSIHTFAEYNKMQINPPKDLHPTPVAHQQWSDKILEFIAKNKLYIPS